MLVSGVTFSRRAAPDPGLKNICGVQPVGSGASRQPSVGSVRLISRRSRRGLFASCGGQPGLIFVVSPSLRGLPGARNNFCKRERGCRQFHGVFDRSRRSQHEQLEVSRKYHPAGWMRLSRARRGPLCATRRATRLRAATRARAVAASRATADARAFRRAGPVPATRAGAFRGKRDVRR